MVRLPEDFASEPESLRAQRDSLSRRFAFGPRATRLSPCFVRSRSTWAFRDFLLGFHPDGLAYRVLPLPRVAIGPLLFAAVMLLSRICSRVLVGAACAILLSVSALNMTLLVGDFYSSDNQEALDEVRQTVVCVNAGKRREGAACRLVRHRVHQPDYACLPRRPQTYMDWQKGNWNLAYEAYSPTLTCKNSWEEIFDGYHGPIGRFGTDPKRRHVA